ncbi:MAG: hypothetical protein ACYC35_14760 [Pirellulales bacterium]
MKTSRNARLRIPGIPPEEQRMSPHDPSAYVFARRRAGSVLSVASRVFCRQSADLSPPVQ